MAQKKDNPRVYIPPPLIYAAFFFLSILIQEYFAIETGFLPSPVAAIIFIAIFLLIAGPALLRFLQTKNTLVTILPAFGR